MGAVAADRPAGAISLGAKALESGVFWVACARRADPEAIWAGLSAAATAVSRLAEWPEPLTPSNDRSNASRDGCTPLDPVALSDAAAVGLSTGWGERGDGAAVSERDGG
jgi:hypothetical protein